MQVLVYVVRLISFTTLYCRYFSFVHTFFCVIWGPIIYIFDNLCQEINSVFLFKIFLNCIFTMRIKWKYSIVKVQLWKYNIVLSLYSISTIVFSLWKYNIVKIQIFKLYFHCHCSKLKKNLLDLSLIAVSHALF